jgi:threonyl-tRNA synthetase
VTTDGAFYAPKIDFYIKDALGRQHQTATVQLDFLLPRQFNLTYLDSHQQPQRPVIIHRAICGSLERMLAILIEHTAGRWPFWLSPRQVRVQQKK